MVGRIVVLFAITGIGIGLTALVFLWAMGAFRERTGGLEDLGGVLVSGIAVSAALVFAVLIGVVLAASGGTFAASQLQGSQRAALAGGMGAALGHAGLVLALGVVMLVGVALLGGGSSEPPRSTLTPQRVEARESCEALFGEGSEICSPPDATVSGSGDDAEDLVKVGTIARLLVGLVPAAIVGAGVGAAFSRR